jgi:hypothetical protein
MDEATACLMSSAINSGNFIVLENDDDNNDE